jgi:hypothetical protein
MSELTDRLKEQIRSIRAKLDPKLLRWAEQQLTGAEPYDRDAAREAIEAFLRGRAGDTKFLKKLSAKMREAGAVEPKKPE